MLILYTLRLVAARDFASRDATREHGVSEWLRVTSLVATLATRESRTF